jgi:hypothetical protein
VFVKLYAHGAPEKNAHSMLGGDLDRTFEYVAQACAERNTMLHFVTAWEMWNAVEAVRLKQDPVSAVRHSGQRFTAAKEQR